MPASLANSKMTFGLYEVDLQTGELWKAGFRVKLQSQPFKVLAMLLEKPGHMVTREELQLRLWGKDTVVDFDHSLGTAINKIREALGDSAENPRFIETLSRRGYRFIAPVGIVPGEEQAESPGPNHVFPFPDPAQTFTPTLETELPSISSSVRPATLLTPAPPRPTVPAAASRTSVRHLGTWSIALIAILTAAASGFFWGSARSTVAPPHITQITHNGHLAPSIDFMENLAAGATDGVHLFAPTINGGQTGLAAVTIAGGSVLPLKVPSEVAGPTLGDISPDGGRLLLKDHLSPESEQPLWVVPTSGESALRVGDVLAHDASWMPDGNGILFANGNDLYLTQLTGNHRELYATLPGRAFWLRWQPNGSLLRFTILDPIAHTLSLWQITTTNRKPQRLLDSFADPPTECCGVWTADGRAFVFESSRGGNADLWELTGTSTTNPQRLTDGPLEFRSPIAARSGHRIFFLGVDARSEMNRLTAAGELVPERGFLSSAVRVDSSRDGQWVAWTDTNGQLWRSRTDGTQKLQLTSDNLDVFLAHWSPEGSRLAVMAREPGKAWQIYLIGANGGDLVPLLKESRNAADPSWSSDGQSLVFGRVNDAMGKENAARTLHILHLANGQIDQIPDSSGLFSPRWSPDGKYIAALSLDQRQVRLYDIAAKTWTTLRTSSGADPVWSPDSKFLFIHASLDPAQPIDRISIPDGRVDEVVRLADTKQNDAVDYVFGGLNQANEPMIRTRVFTGNFYSMTLK